MTQKFKMSKMISKNIEQLIISLIKYSNEDLRIDIFRKFLRIGENRIRREILDCYLTMLKNIPLSFYKLFEAEQIKDANYLMNLDEVFAIYKNKFPNFKLSTQAFDKLIRATEIYNIDNDIVLTGESNYEVVRDKFLLTNLYNKNIGFIEKILNDFQEEIISDIDILEISRYFLIANKEFEINLIILLEIIKNNFIVKDDKIDLQSFCDFYLNKIFFKLKILNFLDISIDRFNYIYNNIDRNIENIWNKADILKKEYIYYKEFESVMKILLGKSQNKWKISDYFK
jgi:hypothetical protein